MNHRPRSAIDALPAYRPGKSTTQAEKEHGITDAIKLASNENPMPPIPAVQAAIVQAAAGLNRYADHRASALRESIAHWTGTAPEQVTVGCGSVGLLQQLFLTYAERGDEVVYPWRSFEVYPVYTQLVGATAVTTPLVNHEFDLDAVAAAVTNRTKLILLATPNNPTGTAVRLGEVEVLLNRIPNDVVVVLDEAYREFANPDSGDPVHRLLPNHPNVVVLRTFSKAHGLAGLRVGYAMAHPDIVTAVDKTLFPFAVNALAQAAALAAIDSIDEVRAGVSAILRERDRVVGELVVAGWNLPAAQANFVYLPLLADTDAIYLAMERRGVVTRPFSNEGIRVTIGTPAENDRFLATLASVTSPR